MNDSSEMIKYQLQNMPVGYFLTVDVRDLRDNPFTGEPGISRILSSIVGSMYSFKYWTHEYRRSVTVESKKNDGTIWHVDFDRLYLYDKRLDGSYIRNDVEYDRHRKVERSGLPLIFGDKLDDE